MTIPPTVKILFRLSNPIHLLLLLLNYSLGLGIARYLGDNLRPGLEVMGALGLMFLLAASSLLTEYFRPLVELEMPFADDRKAVETFRVTQLTVACAFLAVAATLFIAIGTPASGWFLVGLFILLSLSIGLPPFRLEDRGFAEVIRAFLLAVLTPALAFVLQAGEVHRLIGLFTFPLFLLGLAAMIAMRFPLYSLDLKYKRPSLLMRLTWERAVTLHNGLLVCAYLWIACLSFFDVPFALTWPGLLTLPFAAAQLYLLRNISDGAKPLWNPLVFSAAASFGLTAYLFALTFWLR